MEVRRKRGGSGKRARSEQGGVGSESKASRPRVGRRRKGALLPDLARRLRKLPPAVEGARPKKRGGQKTNAPKQIPTSKPQKRQALVWRCNRREGRGLGGDARFSTPRCARPLATPRRRSAVSGLPRRGKGGIAIPARRLPGARSPSRNRPPKNRTQLAPGEGEGGRARKPSPRG